MRAITLLIIFLILVNGCSLSTRDVPPVQINQENKSEEMSQEKTKKSLDDCIHIDLLGGYAWYNVMPGAADDKHPYIIVPILLKHNPICKPYTLSIGKAEVIQSNEVVGDFQPIFQYVFSCNGRLDDEFHNAVSLEGDCEIEVGVRAERDQNTAGINPEIPLKVRFKIYDTNNNYDSGYLVSNEMLIEYAI